MTHNATVKRRLALLLAVVLVFSLGIGAGSVSATSTNHMDRVLSVQGDFNFEGRSNTPILNIRDEDLTWRDWENFRLHLPERVSWNDSIAVAPGESGWVGLPWQPQVSGGGSITVRKLTSRILDVVVENASGQRVQIPLNVDFDGVERNREVRVFLDARDSAMTSGSYVFATTGPPTAILPATVSISEERTFTMETTLGDIRIEETGINTIGEARQSVTLTLSPNFQWVSNGENYRFSGGLVGSSLEFRRGWDARTLELVLEPSRNRQSPGAITLENLGIRPVEGASTGIVRAEIDGDRLASISIAVARWQGFPPEPLPEPVTLSTRFTIDRNTYITERNGDIMTGEMDVAPYIRDDRTFMPLRFAARAVGVEPDDIRWDAALKQVTLLHEGRVIEMQIGSQVMVIDGTATFMDTAPEIRDGRTMLPLFYLARALNLALDWDPVERTVTLHH